MNSKAGSKKATQLQLALSLRILTWEPRPHVGRTPGPQCGPGCSSVGVQFRLWAPARALTNSLHQQSDMLVNKLS